MPLLPASYPVINILNVTPRIDGGRFPIKRTPGEPLHVEADIFKDGHDELRANILWRRVGSPLWSRAPMRPLDNKRWGGACVFKDNALHEYTVEVWPDAFATWHIEYQKKFAGGVPDLTSEKLEGAAFIEAAARRAQWKTDAQELRDFAEKLRRNSDEGAAQLIEQPRLLALLEAWPDRRLATRYEPYLRVFVDRPGAAYAAWYEFFPRSAQGLGDRGSTFRDCLPRIDDAKRMGFDVIYFPPIHPIGLTNRKGKNNSVTCQPGEPGVPYAIGNRHQGCPNGGGHMDVAPELGTLEDFEWLVGEIHARGMELALDFAINCSPDHPYIVDHPDWFYYRPDGTLKYAENPPKKYEDVHPLNFNSADWPGIWREMRDVILFWAERGVKIFRVDNPHTKPVPFWEWTIAEVQRKFPDVVFLSEAFTHPKMMQLLAKVGYTQSYTYFTWRNNKWELQEYLHELTQTETAEYFRGNFFVNTPDINPMYLQKGGRPAFLIRALLANTLSTVYGVYSGFELCEYLPVKEGKEEYLDSEKYQFLQRDWDAPGNIKAWITRLNQIRKENRALRQYRNLHFLPADNDNVLCYTKFSPALDNIIVVVVNVDPRNRHDATIDLPLHDFQIADWESYQVHDLLTGEKWLWQGRRNFISLDPLAPGRGRVAHLFRIERFQRRESGGRMVFGS
jgi:starch synthase (maltosyl-transferring)